MKNFKKVLISLVLVGSISLNGCAVFQNSLEKLNSAFNGRNATIQTYDANGNVVDKIHGKSIMFSVNNEFTQKNSDGSVADKSSVVNIAIGKNSITHVGSSLISFDDGLKDMLNEYESKVDISNEDKSIPLLTRMKKDFENDMTGNDKVVFIRSQQGKPLATFIGQDASIFDGGLDKSTSILIDGKVLLVYRCDYTIYDLDLIE